MLPRVAHRMAQSVDAVALHQPHRPGIVIGPYRLRAAAVSRAGQLLGDLVERIVPGDRRKRRFADPFLPDPAQRLRQPCGVMLALGIAGDLGADDAARVGL